MSYDNSFSAIKTNIFNFKGSIANNIGHALQDNVSVEEKPNKPRGEIEKHLSLNQTHELNLLNITTSAHDDMFNKTAQVAYNAKHQTNQISLQYQTSHKHSKSYLQKQNDAHQYAS